MGLGSRLGAHLEPIISGMVCAFILLLWKAHHRVSARTSNSRGGGGGGAHRKKVPVCPVVSMPAKNSAAISGNIWLSDSGLPVLGSFAFSSRSAKLPGCGFTALMCASRFHTMVCMQPTCVSLPLLIHLLSRWLPFSDHS